MTDDRTRDADEAHSPSFANDAAAPAATDSGDGAVDYIERARALAPRIEAAAPQADRDRRLPDELMAALHEAGLFRLLLPRAYGGAEVDPMTFLGVIEEIAKVDASTAWCLGQNGICALTAASLEPEVAREIFDDPRAILAWGPGPGARAVAVEGGYRVTGNWSFASGGRHATWIGAYCAIVGPDGKPIRTEDGGPLSRTMLFPAAAAPMTDIWNVIGLRGTGSDAYAVTDLFVPHKYSFARDDPSERRLPGRLYCFPTNALFSCAFACVAMGLARSLLDAFVALARGKTPRGYRNPLAESALVQSQVAQAEACLRSARTLLFSTVAEIWETTTPSGFLTLDQRMAIRLAGSHAIQQAREVGDTAYREAGATAVFASNPFERRFRDLHTVTQQLQGRMSHFETVGKHILGVEADTTFL
jgi:alkylation response protein AidB-like acyl-CoA dehydrogenase